MEWKTEALGDIAFMTSGGTPSKKHPEYYKNGTIPWVRSGELENGAIRDMKQKCNRNTPINGTNVSVFNRLNFQTYLAYKMFELEFARYHTRVNIS